MSGLLAGLLLRRAGWHVDIFERVEEELAGRGAGIVVQPDLIATLRGSCVRSDPGAFFGEEIIITCSQLRVEQSTGIDRFDEDRTATAKHQRVMPQFETVRVDTR